MNANSISAGLALKWGLGIAATLIVVALFLPGYNSRARPASRRTQCLNNIRNIALALHNYASLNGSLPPAYIADANGRPMHSWRVLILPYVDRSDIYAAYRFDEPWN